MLGFEPETLELQLEASTTMLMIFSFFFLEYYKVLVHAVKVSKPFLLIMP